MPVAQRLADAVRRWMGAKPNPARENEQVSLEQLEPALLLPLTLQQEHAAEMGLGGKEQEESSLNAEIQLLRSAAAATGLALENSQLMAQIAAEVATREKHKRELEIAREVQQRLFPQDHPPVMGLEYAGACRPALEVGGDYYDFIKLSEHEFGIAIGDVAGKGIPASLLMATLRAYLRGQTAVPERRLASLMTNLNRFVYESSSANRYATFFYAEHNALTHTLTYVNGGHNPPILFRAAMDGSEMVRLDAGGPVIGLLPECDYMQGQFFLSRGDVLVAFTDGLSEAMNADDEDWGEDHLIEAVRCHRELSASALLDRIMESVDVFAAGAPQHDDMTVVVVRAV